ncbi:hypothetical protein HELRODRAFT_176722 [Helobdella robusta]|uniref:C2H2-type domain-containing protein n=1 Tax=Helobdella robusta TaxID=6412 RepID=T1FAU0_HELRO|nr:hypothetical protein HELRODRAFT_176722 [Helobdella robusta]ESN99555.1 hypothetical protein HELRODRAFT_176722 [Helobdella robusta]
MDILTTNQKLLHIINSRTNSATPQAKLNMQSNNSSNKTSNSLDNNTSDNVVSNNNSNSCDTVNNNVTNNNNVTGGLESKIIIDKLKQCLQTIVASSAAITAASATSNINTIAPANKPKQTNSKEIVFDGIKMIELTEFLCDTCLLAFSDLEIANQHISTGDHKEATVTGYHIYCCPTCGIKYRDKVTVKNHIAFTCPLIVKLPIDIPGFTKLEYVGGLNSISSFCSENPKAAQDMKNEASTASNNVQHQAQQPNQQQQARTVSLNELMSSPITMISLLKQPSQIALHQQQQLQQHRMQYHEQQPPRVQLHKCPVCSKVFSSAEYLNLHFSNRHQRSNKSHQQQKNPQEQHFQLQKLSDAVTCASDVVSNSDSSNGDCFDTLATLPSTTTASTSTCTSTTASKIYPDFIRQLISKSQLFINHRSHRHKSPGIIPTPTTVSVPTVEQMTKGFKKSLTYNMDKQSTSSTSSLVSSFNSTSSSSLSSMNADNSNSNSDVNVIPNSSLIGHSNSFTNPASQSMYTNPMTPNVNYKPTLNKNVVGHSTACSIIPMITQLSAPSSSSSAATPTSSSLVSTVQQKTSKAKGILYKNVYMQCEGTYYCAVCKADLSSRESKRNHRQMACGDPKTVTYSRKYFYLCPYCSEKFPSQKECRQHQVSECLPLIGVSTDELTVKELACPLCPKKYHNLIPLKGHMTQVHHLPKSETSKMLEDLGYLETAFDQQVLPNVNASRDRGKVVAFNANNNNNNNVAGVSSINSIIAVNNINNNNSNNNNGNSVINNIIGNNNNNNTAVGANVVSTSILTGADLNTGMLTTLATNNLVTSIITSLNNSSSNTNNNNNYVFFGGTNVTNNANVSAINSSHTTAFVSNNNNAVTAVNNSDCNQIVVKSDNDSVNIVVTDINVSSSAGSSICSDADLIRNIPNNLKTSFKTEHSTSCPQSQHQQHDVCDDKNIPHLQMLDLDGRATKTSTANSAAPVPTLLSNVTSETSALIATTSSSTLPSLATESNAAVAVAVTKPTWTTITTSNDFFNAETFLQIQNIDTKSKSCTNNINVKDDEKIFASDNNNAGFETLVTGDNHSMCSANIKTIINKDSNVISNNSNNSIIVSEPSTSSQTSTVLYNATTTHSLETPSPLLVRKNLNKINPLLNSHIIGVGDDHSQIISSASSSSGISSSSDSHITMSTLSSAQLLTTVSSAVVTSLLVSSSSLSSTPQSSTTTTFLSPLSSLSSLSVKIRYENTKPLGAGNKFKFTKSTIPHCSQALLDQHQQCKQQQSSEEQQPQKKQSQHISSVLPSNNRMLSDTKRQKLTASSEKPKNPISPLCNSPSFPFKGEKLSECYSVKRKKKPEVFAIKRGKLEDDVTYICDDEDEDDDDASCKRGSTGDEDEDDGDVGLHHTSKPVRKVISKKAPHNAAKINCISQAVHQQKNLTRNSSVKEVDALGLTFIVCPLCKVRPFTRSELISHLKFKHGMNIAGAREMIGKCSAANSSSCFTSDHGVSVCSSNSSSDSSDSCEEIFKHGGSVTSFQNKLSPVVSSSASSFFSSSLAPSKILSSSLYVTAGTKSLSSSGSSVSASTSSSSLLVTLSKTSSISPTFVTTSSLLSKSISPSSQSSSSSSHVLKDHSTFNTLALPASLPTTTPSTLLPSLIITTLPSSSTTLPLSFSSLPLSSSLLLATNKSTVVDSMRKVVTEVNDDEDDDEDDEIKVSSTHADGSNKEIGDISVGFVTNYETIDQANCNNHAENLRNIVLTTAKISKTTTNSTILKPSSSIFPVANKTTLASKNVFKATASAAPTVVIGNVKPSVSFPKTPVTVAATSAFLSSSSTKETVQLKSLNLKALKNIKVYPTKTLTINMTSSILTSSTLTTNTKTSSLTTQPLRTLTTIIPKITTTTVIPTVVAISLNASSTATPTVAAVPATSASTLEMLPKVSIPLSIAKPVGNIRLISTTLKRDASTISKYSLNTVLNESKKQMSTIGTALKNFKRDRCRLEGDVEELGSHKLLQPQHQASQQIYVKQGLHRSQGSIVQLPQKSASAPTTVVVISTTTLTTVTTTITTIVATTSSTATVQPTKNVTLTKLTINKPINTVHSSSNNGNNSSTSNKSIQILSNHKKSGNTQQQQQLCDSNKTSML